MGFSGQGRKSHRYLRRRPLVVQSDTIHSRASVTRDQFTFVLFLNVRCAASPRMRMYCSFHVKCCCLPRTHEYETAAGPALDDISSRTSLQIFHRVQVYSGSNSFFIPNSNIFFFISTMITVVGGIPSVGVHFDTQPRDLNSYVLYCTLRAYANSNVSEHAAINGDKCVLMHT